MSSSAASPPTDAGAAIPAGQRLKQTREERGMSIEQVASALRLDVWSIEALESGNFSSLGPSVYIKGHLQKYAALLQLDSGELLAAYERQLPDDARPEPFTMAVHVDKHSQRRRRLALLALAVILVLAAAGAFAWWWWQSCRAGSSSPSGA